MLHSAEFRSIMRKRLSLTNNSTVPQRLALRFAFFFLFRPSIS